MEFVTKYKDNGSFIVSNKYSSHFYRGLLHYETEVVCLDGIEYEVLIEVFTNVKTRCRECNVKMLGRDFGQIIRVLFLGKRIKMTAQEINEIYDQLPMFFGDNCDACHKVSEDECLKLYEDESHKAMQEEESL